MGNAEYKTPWEDVLSELTALSDEKQRGAFKSIWKSLRRHFDYPELDTLRQAYSHDKDFEKLDSLICGPHTLEGKIGALRTLAQLEGWQAKGRLLGVIRDPQQPADIRAWALYDLLLTRIEVDGNCWQELNGPIKCALGAHEQQIRQWAAYLLGEMGRRSRSPQQSYFVSDVHKKEAEALLIQCWKKEININVDRQIVVSLGLVGGYGLDASSKDQNGRYPIVNILHEAADHVNGEVRKLVPDAVASVAKNVVGCSAYKPDLKMDAVGQLLGVLRDWLKRRLDIHEQLCDEAVTSALVRLNDIWRAIVEAGMDLLSDSSPLVAPTEKHASLLDCAEKVLNTPGLVYDSHRLAITTMVEMVGEPHASSRLLTEKGIVQLLGVTERPFLKNPVRARAVDALRELAERHDSGELRGRIRSLALNNLQEMLADPDEKVRQELANALIVLMGDKEGIDFFSNVVLNDEKVLTAIKHCRAKWGEGGTRQEDEEKRQVRMLAAQSLARIGQRYKPVSGEPGAYASLIMALQGWKEPEHRYAREALISIGSEQGVQALVEQDTRQYVDDKYFGPIEDAEEKSTKILTDMVNMSKISYGFTILVAILAVAGGAMLLKNSIDIALGTPTAGWEVLVPALSGLILALAGILTPYFWNSAQAVQKTNGQMTNLITAFHGYLGRMRLIGLGFAHAFSAGTENQEHANFAAAMSNAVGQAILDSSRVLESIGRGPLVETDLTTVPNFVGESKANAVALVDGKSLTLVFKSDNNEAEKDTIFAQDIRAATEVKRGTVVNVTISLGPKESSTTAQA